MKRNLFILVFTWLCFDVNSQKLSTPPAFNLDFETNLLKQQLPDKWIRWGNGIALMQKDSTVAYEGKYSTLISSTLDEQKPTFGSVAYALPAHFKGKTIRLEGFMKIENVATNGFAGILMRLDGVEGKALGFESLEGKKIRGTQDWKKYSVELPLHEETERIYVAGILEGKGKAWFDKFEVFIDNENIKSLKPNKYKAQEDEEFAKGTSIKVATISDVQINNLYKLAKIWGFVKYYHPTIAEGKLNWDNELFRVLPRILEIKNEMDAENKIHAWLENIITNKPNSVAIKPNSNTLKLTANNEWLRDKTLKSKVLENWLLNIENIEKPKRHYYIGFTEGVGNPSFNNELPYDKLDFTDDGVKLLGLFRYWNMINYFFPYRHLMDDNWDKTLKTFIPKIINADDDLAYKLNLLELIGKIQDTHANIWGKDETLHRFWGNNKVPIEVKMIENQVVVTNIQDNSGVGNIQVGDVITAINNKEINQFIEEKIKYCPASNRPTQLRDLMRRLLRTNEESLDIAIKGKENQKVACINLMYLPNKQTDIPPHKLLDDNIAYIYPASLQSNTIEAIMQKYMDTKGLIIDMRCYPSDFIVFKLGKLLMPSPTPFVKFTAGNMGKAGDFEMGQPLSVGETKPDNYKGKVVILINEETQSQAEYTTMALRVAPKATVIGSTTAGADGNVSNIILPGNVRTMISGIGVYYPDGKETQRVGIVPDIELHPTIKGVKNNEDELLNKAIEVVKQ